MLVHNNGLQGKLCRGLAKPVPSLCQACAKPVPSLCRGLDCRIAPKRKLAAAIGIYLAGAKRLVVVLADDASVPTHGTEFMGVDSRAGEAVCALLWRRARLERFVGNLGRIGLVLLILFLKSKLLECKGWVA